jgi:amino acid adenylation domain-containing protein
MSRLSKLPREQEAIRAKCFHPGGAFVEFTKEEVEQSIPDRFEKIVRKYPDRIAVKTAKHTLTYSEINATANRVARAIVATQGRQSEPVALLFDNDAPLIAAILGASKAGKIFVPVDASLPSARIEATLGDSQARLMITDRQNAALAAGLKGVPCRLLEFESIDSRIPADDLRLPIAPAALALIFYTSGSTGQPKGVVWNHRHLLHTAMVHINTFMVCAADRVSLLSSGTSNAVTNAFIALLNGAALLPFLVQKEGAGQLVRWLLRERISISLIGSPLFRALCDTLTGEEQFPDLRILRLRSDSVYRSDIELYKRHFSPTCILVNGLSSSETGPVRSYLIDRQSEIAGDEVPVGYATDDKEILLLDDTGKEVGFGEIGEIVVRSRYLSPCYWRKPELTGAKYQADPHGGEERLYKTGDLGLMLPDGCLIHKGRKDFRVKVRGYGVEFAEIEKALLKHDAVKETVVLAREAPSGDARLVAYLVCGASRPGIGELQNFLRQRLPDYMVPSAFVILEAMPLGAGGKIDRGALPAPGRTRPELENPFVSPSNPVEETLAKIWAEVLGLDQVGIHDNFLDLGGHSLMATRIIARVIGKFGVELPLQSLLEAPTVAQMALTIMENQTKKPGDEDVVGILAELEALSDDEAQRLLSEKGRRRP